MTPPCRLEKVGFSLIPRNAVDAVKSIVHYITERKGGRGAVREICEFILSARK
jgi:3-deoxy-D-manno-octulosonate 8-phosphate phosphatase (KDO 8-P phosphatase)